mmetsp:Transcript_10714/g.17534  ORF Transcript_10714/g.17534 Transcript_10714/m.17534 type:complete len:219 (-) Transcript_10714:44-700(-)
MTGDTAPYSRQSSSVILLTHAFCSRRTFFVVCSEGLGLAPLDFSISSAENKLRGLKPNLIVGLELSFFSLAIVLCNVSMWYSSVFNLNRLCVSVLKPSSESSNSFNIFDIFPCTCSNVGTSTLSAASSFFNSSTSFSTEPIFCLTSSSSNPSSTPLIARLVCSFSCVWFLTRYFFSLLLKATPATLSSPAPSTRCSLARTPAQTSTRPHAKHPTKTNL